MVLALPEGDTKGSPGIIPLYRFFITEDFAGPTFYAILILEMDMSLNKLKALGGAAQNT